MEADFWNIASVRVKCPAPRSLAGVAACVTCVSGGGSVLTCEYLND